MSLVRRIAVLLAAAAIAQIACAARAPFAEAEHIAELLELQPGMRVADVGAGDGEWSEDLARRVGAVGHVYSTEVDEDDLDDIRDRLEKAGLANVTVLLGDQDDTGLPADCCDAILLRLVYHHFTDPEKMRASLRSALRPGGRLVVVEIRPQSSWRELDGVPDRGGHGIAVDSLVEELTGDGFEEVQRDDDWEAGSDHYCVVFREAGPTAVLN